MNMQRTDTGEGQDNEEDYGHLSELNSDTESTDHSSDESYGKDEGDALDTKNATLQAMILSDFGVLDTSVSGLRTYKHLSFGTPIVVNTKDTDF